MLLVMEHKLRKGLAPKNFTKQSYTKIKKTIIIEVLESLFVDRIAIPEYENLMNTYSFITQNAP